MVVLKSQIIYLLACGHLYQAAAAPTAVQYRTEGRNTDVAQSLIKRADSRILSPRGTSGDKLKPGPLYNDAMDREYEKHGYGPSTHPADPRIRLPPMGPPSRMDSQRSVGTTGGQYSGFTSVPRPASRTSHRPEPNLPTGPDSFRVDTMQPSPYQERRINNPIHNSPFRAMDRDEYLNIPRSHSVAPTVGTQASERDRSRTPSPVPLQQAGPSGSGAGSRDSSPRKSAGRNPLEPEARPRPSNADLPPPLGRRPDGPRDPPAPPSRGSGSPSRSSNLQRPDTRRPLGPVDMPTTGSQGRRPFNPTPLAPTPDRRPGGPVPRPSASDERYSASSPSSLSRSGSQRTVSSTGATINAATNEAGKANARQAQQQQTKKSSGRKGDQGPANVLITG
ncbi:hypothetical protein PspLS_07111 [Pyricularia sp. CBS 133598]|nr:hypothetical protein PspLS_07111 [Pyricularia sp. CBS 133598]